MTWTATAVQGGVTKSATASITVLDPFYTGVDANGAGSGATVSGTNATLTGGPTATMTGSLASLNVGSVFTINPAGTKYGYLLTTHQTTAMTFTSGAAPFGLSRVVSGFTFTNQYGVAYSADLYRTDNLLTVSYAVTRAS
jgi:hypothetical protein